MWTPLGLQPWLLAGLPFLEKIADLFEKEPVQWGLRGDPYLWREMKAAFADTPLPESGSAFRTEFERVFLHLVGLPLSDERDSCYIERYAHGGMSSGHISFEFWNKRALSILGLRFANAAGRKRLSEEDGVRE